MPERVYQATSPAGIGRGLVASSFQYYLSGDEHLRVEVLAYAPPVNVDLTWRFWREQDRSIQITRQTLRAITFTPPTAQHYRLEAGALLNLRISTSNSAVKYGHLFVRVQIIHGFDGGYEVVGTLLQGYISAQNDRAWPGSPLEQMKDAPGVVTDGGWSNLATSCEMTVPSGQRFQVMAASFFLTTSAVVANRTVDIVVRGTGGLVLWAGGSPIVQPASSVNRYSFGSGSQPADSPNVKHTILPFPVAFDLAAGHKVEVGATGLQVGDFFGVDGIQVRQWMDL